MIDVWRLRVLVQIDLCTDDTFQFNRAAKAVADHDPHMAEVARSRGEGYTERRLLDVDGVTLQYKTKEHLITATYRVGFKVYPADRFVLLGP